MFRPIKPSFRVLIALLAWAIPGGALLLVADSSDRATATLPVSRVVLYSSGVGLFEHTGTVDGNAVARLSFKAEQINDVLKSMVLRDFGGGSATAVNYASQDPITRALRSFAIDLSDKPTLAMLLDRLRGAGVTLMAPQAISGTIVGVEQQAKVLQSGQNSTSITDTILNLLTSDGLRSVPLSAVSTIKLSDPRLNDELTRALALIIDAADTQRKSVDLSFDGNGTRKVAIDYVSEAPVWKTSYRLDLSGAGQSASSKADAPKGFLQGWAIVENTSDSDWNGITLSLASGSPISFIQDLYTPLYVQRPQIAPSVQASVTPHSYDEGIANDSATPSDAEAAAPSAPAPAMASGPGMYNRAAKSSMQAGLMAQDATIALNSAALTPTASVGKFGDLFNFTIKTPVSLQRRQSAMLPLINQEISAEKVSIYNAGVLERNPLAGALVTNSTGLRLPPGPITVFDSGMYSGDALIQTFGENDHRLISYAVDLDVLVDSNATSSSDLTKISIINGVLTINQTTTWTQTYRIQNKATNDKILMLEHPRTYSRDLVDTAKPFEETDALYRFRVPLAKSGQTKFTVKEQQPGSETVALLNSDSSSFLYYLENAKSSPAVRAALQKAAALKQKQATLQAQVNDLTNQKAEIENGQGRLRSNIETVGRDSPQGQRYLQKLTEGEDAIDKFIVQIKKAKDQAKAAQEELEAYLKDLQVQ